MATAPANTDCTRKKKLKVMIITMGGQRQEFMKQLFEHELMVKDFEAPVFVPGVPARALRNRQQLLEYAAAAGLLPDSEWRALQQAFSDNNNNNNNKIDGVDTDENLNHQRQNACTQLFDCLQDIPVTPGRRGSKLDVEMHYSVELWRKAKTVNRGRSVLGCTFAHLMAWKQFTNEGFDLLLEDNVRVPLHVAAARITEARAASEEWEKERNVKCHLRYLGWLGSLPNLKWIFTFHLPQRKYERQRRDGGKADTASSSLHTVVPFPTTQDIERNLALNLEKKKEQRPTSTQQQNESSETNSLTHDEIADEQDDNDATTNVKPGGTPVWGCYAYWISKQAYEGVVECLRQDVGALLWKGKRMRYYKVKPIDKILPRAIMSSSLFDPESVHLATHPTLFRAPMLTSKIHTQWDPEFCRSTSYQLEQAGLQWSDLWLTPDEQEIVQYYQACGEWLTLAQLQERKKQNPFR